MCHFCRSIALQFGCAKSALWNCVQRVVDSLLIVNAEQQVIHWPTSGEVDDVMLRFRNRSALPGSVIHAITVFFITLSSVNVTV